MDQKMVKRRWQKPLDDRQMRKCSLRQEGFVSRSPWEPRKIKCIFKNVEIYGRVDSGRISRYAIICWRLVRSDWWLWVFVGDDKEWLTTGTQQSNQDKRPKGSWAGAFIKDQLIGWPGAEGSTVVNMYCTTLYTGVRTKMKKEQNEGSEKGRRGKKREKRGKVNLILRKSGSPINRVTLIRIY